MRVLRAVVRRLAAAGDAFLRPPVDDGQVWVAFTAAGDRITRPSMAQGERWGRKQAEALLSEAPRTQARRSQP